MTDQEHIARLEELRWRYGLLSDPESWASVESLGWMLAKFQEQESNAQKFNSQFVQLSQMLSYCNEVATKQREQIRMMREALTAIKGEAYCHAGDCKNQKGDYLGSCHDEGDEECCRCVVLDLATKALGLVK